MKKKDYIGISIMVLGFVILCWCLFFSDKVTGLLFWLSFIVGLTMTFGPILFKNLEWDKERDEEAKKEKKAYEMERDVFVSKIRSMYNGVNELTREQIAEDPQYYYNLICKVVDTMTEHRDFCEYLDLDFEKVDLLQKQIEELWIEKFEAQDELKEFLKYHDWYLLNR